MRFLTLMLIAITVFVISSPLWGCNCPLDHLFVGCNEDEIGGTSDDNKLFVDCRQKYRHSDPLGSPPPHPIDYLNRFYPLYRSDIPPHDYCIGEPGFDTLRGDIPSHCDAYDPIRCLVGDPNVDYRVIIECISITPGFRATHFSYYPPFNIIIDEPGDSFNLSGIGDGCHLHLAYKAPDPNGATDLFWITWRMYDAIEDANQYEPSELFTIVFNRELLSGDLAVDGIVNSSDVAELCHYWLAGNGSIHNDYYERADANKDEAVDFSDFALLAANWLESID